MRTIYYTILLQFLSIILDRPRTLYRKNSPDCPFSAPLPLVQHFQKTQIPDKPLLPQSQQRKKNMKKKEQGTFVQIRCFLSKPSEIHNHQKRHKTCHQVFVQRFCFFIHGAEIRLPGDREFLLLIFHYTVEELLLTCPHRRQYKWIAFRSASDRWLH